jgi:hypothetical protein
MTNREVFKKFAARQEGQAGSVRSVSISGGVLLYSYATPIAVFPTYADGPTFTTRKFSATTSKQQTQAKAECGIYYTLTDEDFRAAARAMGADFSMAR